MSDWRKTASEMLREGYGVEDIAVRTGEDIGNIRRFVAALRMSGRLSVVLFGRRYRGATA